MPGTEPSSSASPASAAMPVTVPIVSKKSLSMIAKIVSAAVMTPSLLKALPRSKSPSMEAGQLGVRSTGRMPW